MSIKSGSYANFRRALDTRNLLLIRAAAAELQHPPPLDDALRICLVLRDSDPDSYGRAVVRWLGRFCLERPNATLANILDAAAAFDRLPTQPGAAVGPAPPCSPCTQRVSVPAARLS